MQKYGFVYLWYDIKHKRFYVGCRWGNEADGYICSSSWMKQAYKTRPQDFKRRILKTGIESKKQLLDEEYRWLSKIKPSELKIRYYNMHNHHYNHWCADERSTLSVGQKISNSPLRNERISQALCGRQFSNEHREKIRQAKIGKKHSVEHKNKISQGGKGRKYTQESKDKISAALVGLKRGPMSEEQKELRRKPKSEETKQKISASMKNRINKENAS